MSRQLTHGNVRRSETHSFALPNIQKLTSRYTKMNSSRNSAKHSSFLERVKQITPDVEYDYMENTGVTQQQQKLKDLLRDFNQQSYYIMKKYMNKRIDDAQKRERGSSTSSIEIKQRQIHNNQGMIEICQHQIQMLEHRCQNLKYLSVQEFHNKIDEIGRQIEVLNQQNKQIRKANMVRGLSMVREKGKLNQLRALEYDKHLFYTKKNKLLSENQNTSKESEQLKEKDNKLGKQFQQVELLYQTAIKQQEQRSITYKNLEVMKDKEKSKASNKGKIATFDSKHQHRYLQVLKDLQQTVKRNKKIETQITAIQSNTDKTKKDLVTLEEKMTSLKPYFLNQSITLLSNSGK